MHFACVVYFQHTSISICAPWLHLLPHHTRNDMLSYWHSVQNMPYEDLLMCWCQSKESAEKNNLFCNDAAVWKSERSDKKRTPEHFGKSQATIDKDPSLPAKTTIFLMRQVVQEDIRDLFLSQAMNNNDYAGQLLNRFNHSN